MILAAAMAQAPSMVKRERFDGAMLYFVGILKFDLVVVERRSGEYSRSGCPDFYEPAAEQKIAE